MQTRQDVYNTFYFQVVIISGETGSGKTTQVLVDKIQIFSVNKFTRYCCKIGHGRFPTKGFLSKRLCSSFQAIKVPMPFVYY